MNVVVLGGWAYLLSRYSNSDTVMLGQTVSGRDPSIRHVEEIVGLLIRTIPACVAVESDLAIGEWLTRLHARSVERERYSYYPLPQIRQCCDLSAAEALFESLVVFENYPVDEVLKDAARHGSGQKQIRARLPIGQASTHDTTNYDLTLLVMPGPELRFKLSYRAERFAQESIDQLMRHFLLVLDGMASGKYSTVGQLPLLSSRERQQLTSWNETARACADERCIHELFEEQVECTPDAIAVLHERQSLTYRELNDRANQLARYLRSSGVGPDQLVGICVERGLEMVIGLLGILKAGGAYLPLDPTYPAERLAYLLTDAAPKVLLTQERLRQGLGHMAVERLVVLDTDWDSVAQLATDNLDPEGLGLHARHLAYVIYTSGSTGQPKGVMVEHKQVTRLFAATEDSFHFSERDVWTLFHSFAFDFSVWELWGALLYGGRAIVVPSLMTRSPQEFFRLLCEEGVTVLNQTPSAFAQLIDASDSSDLQHRLRVVIFGGEALELRVLRPWVRRNGAEQPRLVNMYGITETTVHVTYKPLSAQEIESDGGSPIGRPLADLHTYLLDRSRQPVPVGVVGEIYVAGAGVARGYLRRDELTAERFLRDPFSADPRVRMYKTGDLGRWREDGTLEYLGRNDQQVKIRGFRIELGEIEAQLARHPGIKEARVLALEDAGERRLVAYGVPRVAAMAPGVESLREHLSRTLPEYMVPGAFVMVERFALTANGKLDRKALPAPQQQAYLSRQYEAPRSGVEQTLAGIWQEILRLQQVGRYDSFFELGGHSLLAIQLATRIRQTFSAVLPIRQVFEHATLSAQARAIEQARDVGVRTEIPIEAVSREEPLPLSYAQQRMLFLDEFMK
jgi:amino acid adenylation domain-containing protein